MNKDKLDNAIINDDLNALNQLKADEKDIDAFLGTNEYLNFVAGHGAKEILKDMLNNHDWSEDAKYLAMEQACENKQVESILVLGSQGENVFFALVSMAREDDGKPIIDRIVNELDYKLSDSETNRMKEMTNNAIEQNGKYSVDMSYVANAYEQKEYKQAFKNFITNAEMTDGMDEQKAMLSASAHGTAAHIDHYISIGDKATNDFWLKNLDVACNFGNNETAKRLVEHGAKVSDDNIKAAEKYLQPGTVEVLKQAKLDQVEHQSFSLERTNKPRQSQKRNQGLSLS